MSGLAGVDAITQRLEELDREWGLERVLQTNAAAIGLLGLGLGALDRRWLMLSALVSAMLLQHAVLGLRAPVSLLERLGFRGAKEIERERTALMALRGDFRETPDEDLDQVGYLELPATSGHMFELAD